MKKILRNTVFNSLSLFISSLFLTGVRISGGFWSYVLAGFFLSLLFFILRPVFTVLTFPLRFLTFGAITFLINAFVLYILTVVYPSVSVGAFVLKGFSFAGFIVPKIHFNTFFTFVALSIAISGIMSILTWITEK